MSPDFCCLIHSLNRFFPSYFTIFHIYIFKKIEFLQLPIQQLFLNFLSFASNKNLHAENIDNIKRFKISIHNWKILVFFFRFFFSFFAPCKKNYMKSEFHFSFSVDFRSCGGMTCISFEENSYKLLSWSKCKWKFQKNYSFSLEKLVIPQITLY